MEENQNIEKLIQESEKIGEQIAEAYDKGYLNSLVKANAKVVKAFKQRYEAIGYQLKYGLITEEEYYDKLAVIRDSYFSRNTQEWHKYTEEIYNYKVGALNDYKKAVEENLEEVLKISRNKFEEIEKEQQGYSDKLKDYAGGKGFRSYEVYVGNYYPNGDPLRFDEHVLTDYEKEIEKLKKFNQSIEQLKERAAEIDPETFNTFFSELKDMSIDDAQIFADLLNKTSESDFKEYFSLYQERNELSDAISASFYSDEYDNLAKELKSELEQEFSSVPEEFFVYGELTGENFAQGFKSEIEGLFDELKLNIDMANVEIGAPENTSSNVFSPTYYFYGERETTSRTRMHTKDDVLYQYMRGMY